VVEHLPTAVLLPLVALCGIVAVWYVQDLLAVLHTPTLPLMLDAPLDGPLVSVIIPARDEAARIGACLTGLAAQRYHRFEVIVMDDHSSDGTADVVRAFAPRLPALSVFAGATLPNGWAGKCWACWQGASQARGELLLFLDADVAPQPDLLATMIARTGADRLDMLSLIPLVRLDSLAERLVLPAFIALIARIFPLAQVNDPRSPLSFAIGQCLLMRRVAYAAVGGHRAVRGSVLEDMELAHLAKTSGLRMAALDAPNLIEVRMYSGWASLVEGLRKNAIAGSRSGGWRSALFGLRQLLMVALPLDLLAAGAWLTSQASNGAGELLWCGGLLLLLGMICWGLTVGSRHRVSPLWGVLFPLGVAAYYGIAAGALLRVWAGRGVVWKGRVFTR
jgi:hypothetical protein